MAIVKILQIEHASSIFTLINKLDGTPVTMRMTRSGQPLIPAITTILSEREVKAVRDMFGFRLERIL